MSEYAGLALFALLGFSVVVLMMVATTVLGPKLRFAEKVEPFECGERQLVSPYQRFSVKFYLVAVLFILFDIEVVFMYPWAVLFGDLGWFGFIEMGLFILVLAAGLIYAWMKGALDWS
jgi:NADH-quinone oxidoreductase subunit A